MATPVTIACVKWGKQFGSCWVNRLFAMVRRHLPQGMQPSFTCFTDNPARLDAGVEICPLPQGLNGWWNKLYLFREGSFAPGTRVLYFDLDTLITGDLKPLLDYRGEFAILRDFYRPHGYGSGVMLWRAGALDSIWSRYEAAGKPEIAGGDQAWIEKTHPGADLLQDLFPGLFASFKADCQPLPPEGARVICFHGDPKQDDCDAPWVRELWKNGGAGFGPYKTRDEEKRDYARQNAALPYPSLGPAQAHDGHAVIIGGGPSLALSAEALHEHAEKGHRLFAVNNSRFWLGEQGIAYQAHVMADALEEHAAFVPEDASVTHYYAATCHPAVFAKARGNVTLWGPEPLGTGSTVGIAAIRLAHTLGFRHFHLYGFDSCCDENGRHHAYAQPASDTDRQLVATFAHRRFSAAPWMIAQAKEFFPLADGLIREGCSVTVYGEGLIPFMSEQAMLAGQ